MSNFVSAEVVAKFGEAEKENPTALLHSPASRQRDHNARQGNARAGLLIELAACLKFGIYSSRLRWDFSVD
jgi:hypothetical protein